MRPRFHPPKVSQLLTCLVAGISACAGCGDGRPQRVPVSGYVLIDGQPLAKAAVRFYPPNGRSSSGTTDASGRFSLSCFDVSDGALLGTHRVIVAAVDEVSGNTIKWRSPKKYSEADTSGIEATIDGPRDDLKLELTWGGDKPFLEIDGRRVEIR